ncbi:MAG: DUF1573 domain-containing protein [Odoribacteraceae bacterium]|jgi:hypothetical protein|nr:DUF1573 domain-containing protein [Odoribacteraceae bacterium]
MKRIFFFAIAALLIITGGVFSWKTLRIKENESITRRETTSVEVLNERVHLGTFNISEAKEGVFEIRNSGEIPLIILDATTSCNCTTVEWPRKPVNPGDTARVRVTYTPNDRGRFSKTIDLYCNTLPALVTLRVDGYIE